MSAMKRIDRAFAEVDARTRRLDLRLPDAALDQLRIELLSQATDISRNNLSLELGRLYKQGKLLRVGRRPVYYLALEAMEHLCGRTFVSTEFDSTDQLRHYLSAEPSISASAPEQAQELYTPGRILQGVSSELDNLIGSTHSLATPIRQAKAAVMYPPHGLHTLITGKTGVGKSRFAQCIYDFLLKSRVLPPNAAFITYNCAYYSDNPQLLLSQLFGYVKGAFTGADKDHAGLVEHADGGILFLDEIHRLSPEGQEKLFLLIDNGTFYRLGDTQKERRADVRIIGATTEEPQAVMLSTFLRRIPVHITLPQLSERSVEERLELIFYFIWKEAQTLKRRIFIDREIIRIFVCYKCDANIGQLSTDIRLTCANAYFDYLSSARASVKIDFSHLCQNVQKGLYSSSSSSLNPNNLIDQSLTSGIDQFVVDGQLPFQELKRSYLRSVTDAEPS